MRSVLSYDQRSVVVLPPIGLLRGSTVTPEPARWAPKDPLIVTTRRLDMRELLDGRRIIGLGCAANGGVVVVSAVHQDAMVTLRLHGGTPGMTARVEVQVLCDDGTSEPVAILLPICPVLTLSDGAAMPISMSITTTTSAPAILGPLPFFAPTGASVSLRGQVIARNTLTSDTISWDVAATIKYFGTANAVVEGSSILPYQPVDSGLSACGLALTLANGALGFTVTGINAPVSWTTNISTAAA